MPIRTHRGRAAVYRRLWGWPLRSPKHLVGAVIVLGVLVIGVGLALPEPPPSPGSQADHSASAKRQQADPQRDERADDPPRKPPSISVPTEPPRRTEADPAGVDTVRAWGQHWVDFRGSDKQQWLKGLRPYTTDEFITVMETVDPANAGKAVTGPPKPITSTRTSMAVRLPTDVGKLRVTAVRTSDGWRVSEYTQEG